MNSIAQRMAELGARTRLRELFAEVVEISSEFKEIASEFKEIAEELVAEIKLPTERQRMPGKKTAKKRVPKKSTKKCGAKRVPKKSTKKEAKKRKRGPRACSKCGSTEHDARKCKAGLLDTAPAPAPTKSRKRRAMTAAEKAKLSARMKAYWTKRRVERRDV